MNSLQRQLKIGIVGCGAIGSRIAKSVYKELKGICTLSGVYDINEQKAKTLEKSLKLQGIYRYNLKELIDNCDCVIEAVNAQSTYDLVKEALKAKKHVLAMSVGKLIAAEDLFMLAKKNRCNILIPSGAIAGIDAIKAASLVKIDKITLTTRKPPAGFINYFQQKGISVKSIKKETVLFDGDVASAVKIFPQNINVAATIALASGVRSKLRIRIITSPKFKTNSHEIEIKGEFGSMVTRTDNVVCPDNPKTSYLAVLSGIQTLKQFCTGILIGT